VRADQPGAGAAGRHLGEPCLEGAHFARCGSGLCFSLGDVYVRGGPADTVYNGDAMCGGAAAGRLPGRWRGAGDILGLEAPEAA
jgi:hypothetical protein